MALIAVAPGELAAIITWMEMRAKPPVSNQLPAMAALRLDHWQTPDLDKYRALYRQVGERWLWRTRLELDDAALAAIIHDPAVEVRAVCRRNGIAIGLIELDFRTAGEVELAFFGLQPDMTGRGFGNWMMAQAMRLAWRPGIERVWLHSCTLDHPAAQGFYQRHGFVPYRRAVELFADPRICGLLPQNCAPDVPLMSLPDA